MPQDVALRFQIAMIAGSEPASSFLNIRTLRPPANRFVPVRQLDKAVELILDQARHRDVYIATCPREREDGTAGAVARAHCVWVDCDNASSVERLRAFQPRPSLVIRSGSDDGETPCMHAWWQLAEPVPAGWARRATRRLARAFGADVKCAEPARLLRPAGSLNHKHTPPRPVECVFLESAAYELVEIVGGLEDEPESARAPLRVIEGGAGSTDGLVRSVAEAQVGERNQGCSGRLAVPRRRGGLARSPMSCEPRRSALVCSSVRSTRRCGALRGRWRADGVVAGGGSEVAGGGRRRPARKRALA